LRDIATVSLAAVTCILWTGADWGESPQFKIIKNDQCTGIELSKSYDIIRDLGSNITSANTNEGARFIINFESCWDDTLST
jgi:hypothetical protein